MRTRTHRLTLAAVLAVLNGPATAAPPSEYEVSDYLPLAVGNAWAFRHVFYDLPERNGPLSRWPAYLRLGPDGFPAEVVITVERTEEIGGETYYVLSDMPDDWPPAPPHFLAGKKVRWKGTRLMVHTGLGEEGFFRFDGVNMAGYYIPATEDDDRVTAGILYDTIPGTTREGSVPEYGFGFYGYDFLQDWPEGAYYGSDHVDYIRETFFIRGGGRGVTFLAEYGLSGGAEVVEGWDYHLYENSLSPLWAILHDEDDSQDGATGQSGPRKVYFKDAREDPNTSVPSSSWGEVKEGTYR